MEFSLLPLDIWQTLKKNRYIIVISRGFIATAACSMQSDRPSERYGNCQTPLASTGWSAAVRRDMAWNNLHKLSSLQFHLEVQRLAPTELVGYATSRKVTS
jgi:hypothetical protein